MRISHVLYRSLAALLLCAGAFTNAANAQTTNDQTPAPVQQPTTTLILPQEKTARPVAIRTDLYCAGFVQYVPAPINPEIVGGEQEQERRAYSAGDYVYINAGAQQGVKVGQEFSIVRPRGQMTSKFTTKKGWLGVYMQELGQLRVLKVEDRASLAIIANSCDTILLGDLLRQVNNRVAAGERSEVVLDRFTVPTGKQRGRILMSRQAQEMLSRNFIVYIDLGAEDNVKAGDYLTIYRPIGTGNLTKIENEEIAHSRMSGFQSDRFQGGKFSNQSQRVKDYKSAPGLFLKNDEPVTTHEIKRHRPHLPRKVVGEMVILNVQTRTATAIITRVTQEIHTGDFVEVQ